MITEVDVSTEGIFARKFIHVLVKVGFFKLGSQGLFISASLERFWEVIPDFRALAYETTAEDWAWLFASFGCFDVEGFVCLGSS